MSDALSRIIQKQHSELVQLRIWVRLLANAVVNPAVSEVGSTDSKKLAKLVLKEVNQP